MLRTLGGLQQPLLGIAESTIGRYKPSPKPVIPAERFEPFPATSKEELDRIVAALDARSQAWADTAPKERAKLLRSCLDTTLEVAEEAATVVTRYKGSWGSGIGEELISFVPILSGLREYADTFDALAAGTVPRPNQLFRRADTGQWVADVFPMGLEALLFGGFKGEVWIEPGKEPTQCAVYRSNSTVSSSPGVGLVLGAGNQTPVVCLDILHVLVAQNQVVVCKMNPVNECLGPYLRRALLPLVEKGFVEFAYGGGAQGEALCNHPLVKSVHITGSAATYDAIVWGGKPKIGDPPFKKPVGAELGCVTPYIVVPGIWSDSDIEYHAETVASGLVQNAGHNCLKAEVLVTDAAWPQREEFLAALRRHLANIPTRVAYYPGSGRKAAGFKSKFPDAEQIGGSTVLTSEGELQAAPEGQAVTDTRRLPWMIKTGLTPDEVAADEEFWCGVMQEVALPGCGGDAAKFLPAATKFANERCWGTLSCGIIAHPETQKAHKAEFEAAITGLKYGGISINVPSTMVFASTKLSWGGIAAGSTPQAIGSGNCVVHNTMMFDHVEKSVVRAPWKFHPRPLWAPTHANLEGVAKPALEFFAKPSLTSMLPMVPQALRG